MTPKDKFHALSILSLLLTSSLATVCSNQQYLKIQDWKQNLLSPKLKLINLILISEKIKEFLDYGPLTRTQVYIIVFALVLNSVKMSLVAIFKSKSWFNQRIKLKYLILSY